MARGNYPATIEGVASLSLKLHEDTEEAMLYRG